MAVSRTSSPEIQDHQMVRRRLAMQCGLYGAIVLLGASVWGEVGTPRADASWGDVRGVTVSTHGGGRDWGSDEMVRALEEIRELGANWVAIHPYASIGADGEVRLRAFDGEAPRHLTRPIAEAHRLGLKILVKPHLAYWRSPFSWRGEIEFEEPEQWERFFKSYERFVVQLARWTADADGFIVGTELDKTVHHEARWRALIQAIRGGTQAPLSYAANWDRVNQVPFWDALDAIGVQAYFPLTDSENTQPTEAELRHGWERWTTELEALSSRADRPILFTELGYNQSYRAADQPWDYATDDGGAAALQQLCMRVALSVAAAHPRIQGVFLWKWFPPPRSVGRNFQLATPEMRRLIKDSWRGR